MSAAGELIGRYTHPRLGINGRGEAAQLGFTVNDPLQEKGRKWTKGRAGEWLYCGEQYKKLTNGEWFFYL